MQTKKEKEISLDTVAKDFFSTVSGDPKGKKAEFLFSTDSLSGYGLDLVVELAQEAGFDGLDLAIWKNFDARNVSYVKKLCQKHDFPVKVIQVSSNVNEKEMTKALDLCYAVGADTISINAPQVFNFRAYNYIVDNLPRLKKDNKDIRFTIINPEDSNIFALPIPSYRFSNIVEIIRKYLCYVGLDVSNMDSNVFESDFMRKIKDFLPYISVFYISDKNKAGKDHMLPGDGILNLPLLLKKLKDLNYARYISTKVTISKADLADTDKVKFLMKKMRKYYEENYL